jgi:uncharacterized protein DUF4434
MMIFRHTQTAAAGVMLALLTLACATFQPEDNDMAEPRIRCAPLLLTGPYGEYAELDHWGLDQWTQEELETLFDEMQHDGLDLILLPTCSGEEVCWPSASLPNRFGDRDWYGELFDLAAAHEMSVMLPGHWYTYHLQFQGQSWDAAADLAVNERLLREMHARYGDRPNFWGWYIPHETGDRIHRGDIMTLLRALPRFLKELTPDKPVAFSPWFTSRLTVGANATTPAEFAAEWDSMLNEIDGIDICAIQDSTAPHEEIGEWFAAAAPVFAKHGIELWSVVELFPREPVATMGRAIEPERMAEKMRVVAPDVTGYACWEYQNYLNPHSAMPGAAALSTAYRE